MNLTLRHKTKDERVSFQFHEFSCCENFEITGTGLVSCILLVTCGQQLICNATISARILDNKVDCLNEMTNVYLNKIMFQNFRNYDYCEEIKEVALKHFESEVIDFYSDPDWE